jgi:hypothetical protein
MQAQNNRIIRACVRNKCKDGSAWIARLQRCFSNAAMRVNAMIHTAHHHAIASLPQKEKSQNCITRLLLIALCGPYGQACSNLESLVRLIMFPAGIKCWS